VRASLTFIARLSGITLAFYGLLRTQQLEELVPALRWFGLPYRAALVVTITFRYVPFLAGTWQNVRDAHRLRATTNGRRGFAASWMPVLSSVLIQAVRGIPALAMALESRGLGRPGRRGSFARLGSTRRLLAQLAVIAFAMGCLLAPLVVPSARALLVLPGL
jgi:energy-coupling factor transport system permease protein